MGYWLCKGGAKLRAEINALYPKRDKRSDGWIGDAAHAAGKSDHNPDWSSNPPGVVRAIDVDEDLLGAGKPDPINANRLVNQLLTIAREGKDRGRLQYIIFERKIWSRPYGWRERPYSGINAHSTHIHISFTPKADADGRTWNLKRV